MIQLIILGAHTPPTIYQQDNVLIAFILVFARYKFLSARGGFPIQLSQTVSNAVFTQLLKLQTAAAPWFLFYTHLACVVVGREQGVGRNCHKIWIHFHPTGVATAVANFPQAEGAGDLHVARFNFQWTAFEW